MTSRFCSARPAPAGEKHARDDILHFRKLSLARYQYWRSMTDNPLNVLLVEDDDGIAALQSAALERAGFRVKLAKVGQRALECLDRCERLALVVLDYRLPDMTGADIVETLGDRLATLPVIMVTGYPDPVVEERMRAAGVSDYIVKDLELNFLDRLPIAALAAVELRGREEGKEPCAGSGS